MIRYLVILLTLKEISDLNGARSTLISAVNVTVWLRAGAICTSIIVNETMP